MGEEATESNKGSLKEGFERKLDRCSCGIKEGVLIGKLGRLGRLGERGRGREWEFVAREFG